MLSALYPYPLSEENLPYHKPIALQSLVRTALFQWTGHLPRVSLDLLLSYSTPKVI